MPEPEIVLLSDDSEDEAGPSGRALSSSRANSRGRAGPAGRGARASSSSRAGPSRVAARQSERRRRGVEVNMLQEAGDSPRVQPRLGVQDSPSSAVVDLTKVTDEEVLFISRLTSPRGKRGRKAGSVLKSASPALPARSQSPTGGAAKCPICMDVMTEMACGPCGHVFCNGCLRDAVKVQKKCPTCRRTMQPRSIHRIYINTD